MAISYLVWNIRHFKGDPDRVQEVSELITELDPDVFGLLEFKAKSVMRTMLLEIFPNYDFAITDSRMGTEIVVGWRKGKFQQAIWTQKREFRSGNEFLRPGSLLSVSENNSLYNFLFLHTDSGTKNKDYKNRQNMFKKVWKLNERLTDISSTNTPNLVVLGDLNTMGKGSSFTGEMEIDNLKRDANDNNMKMLVKDANYTWHNWGQGPRDDRRPLTPDKLANADKSDLDHVIVSNGLNVIKAGINDADIHVKGWNQLSGQECCDFLWDISDHSAIYGKIES